MEKPVVQPVAEKKLEDPQPPPSEPMLDLQPEPTIKFLSTLLTAAESPEAQAPRRVRLDLQTQESRFLDKEDWGAQRTSEEISHLQHVCKRLQESLSTIQADNLALREKLQNLPDTLYKNLKEEGKAVQEGAQEPTPPGGPGCSGGTGSVVARDEGGHTSPPLPETT